MQYVRTSGVAAGGFPVTVAGFGFGSARVRFSCVLPPAGEQGAYAEFVAARSDDVAHTPPGWTHEARLTPHRLFC